MSPVQDTLSYFKRKTLAPDQQKYLSALKYFHWILRLLGVVRTGVDFTDLPLPKHNEGPHRMLLYCASLRQQQHEPRELAWARADGRSAPASTRSTDQSCSVLYHCPEQVRLRHPSWEQDMARGGSLLCSCTCLGTTSIYVTLPNDATPSSCCNYHVTCRLTALLGVALGFPVPVTATQRKLWHIKSREIT